MCSERHLICIKVSTRLCLFPYNVIPPEFSVTLHQIRSEHPITKQNNSPIIFNDTFILFPQWLKWNYGVPLISCCLAVRQVSADKVDGFIIYFLHSIQTIFIINFIYCNHLIHKSKIHILCCSKPVTPILFRAFDFPYNMKKYVQEKRPDKPIFFLTLIVFVLLHYRESFLLVI